MSAEIVHMFDFTPRAPRDRDTEISIVADLGLLNKIERWLTLQRTICVRDAKPMPPAMRLLVMDAMDILDL